jgi:LPS sulfotransferase NodH
MRFVPWPGADDRRRPTDFIVLGSARSGSNLLSFSLDERLDVEMLGEILDTEQDNVAANLPAHVRPYDKNEDGAAFLAQQIFPPSTADAIQARGFKIFYDHARTLNAQSAWRYLIGHREIRVIHLYRRNLFDSYVSLQVALRTGRWFQRAGTSGVPPPEPFEADPWDCLQYFHQVSGWRRWAEEAFASHKVMTIEYDRDLCENFPRTIIRTCKFLRVAPTMMKAPLVRQQSLTPSVQISNYDELRRWFRYTPYEDFFPAIGVGE